MYPPAGAVSPPAATPRKATGEKIVVFVDTGTQPFQPAIPVTPRRLGGGNRGRVCHAGKNGVVRRIHARAQALIRDDSEGAPQAGKIEGLRCGGEGDRDGRRSREGGDRHVAETRASPGRDGSRRSR